LNVQSQRILLAFSSAAILLAGCGKTVLITRAPQATAPPLKTEPVDGVPFYVKRAYCQQKAAWLEPQYSVRVTGMAEGKPLAQNSVETTMSRSRFLRDWPLHQLVEQSGQPYQVKTRFGCYQYMHTHDLVRELQGIVVAPIDDSDITSEVQDGDLLLAENSAQLVPYVDYQTVYYYNTSRPLTGTSQADVKLAADGTMTEGSSQVNDETLSSVTGVFSSLLSGAGAAAVPLMGASPPPSQLPQECQDFPGETAAFTVTYTVRVYQHTHLFKDPANTELACLARPLAEAERCGAGCSILISEVPAPAAAPAPDKPDSPTPTPPKPDPKPDPKPKP
jgi:hypothetical protein